MSAREFGQGEPDAVIDGVGYDRVYVVELEAGDVTPWGEVVEAVERISDQRTHVTFATGATSSYGKADSTVLVRR